MVITVSDKSLVVQHNKIIEARYKLSIGEQRLVKLLVSMIEADDEDFKKYRIHVTELANLLDIKRKDFYAAVKLATKKLIGNVLTFEMNDETIQTSWLASAHYYKGNGVVDLQFSPVLKPFLLQLKSHFTSYELGNVIHLKRTYSIRLYELLKQYEKIGRRRFTVENLRNVLMVDSSQYKLFQDFKRYILIAAQEELREKTDIDFDIIEERKWKTCVAIEFIIKPKTRSHNVSSNDEPTKNTDTQKENPKNTLVVIPVTNKPSAALVDLLVQVGVSQKTAETLVKEHQEEQIQAAIAYTQAQQKEGKVKNPGGFVIEAIRNGYRDSHAEERKRKEESARAEANKESRRKEWERIKTNWNAWKAEKVQAYIAAMDTETREREKAMFRESLKGSLMARTVYASQESEARHFRIHMTGKVPGLKLLEWAQIVGVDMSPFEEFARLENKL